MRYGNIDSKEFEGALAKMKNLTFLELHCIDDLNYKKIGKLSGFIPFMTALRHLSVDYNRDSEND